MAVYSRDHLGEEKAEEVIFHSPLGCWVRSCSTWRGIASICAFGKTKFGEAAVKQVSAGKAFFGDRYFIQISFLIFRVNSLLMVRTKMPEGF